MAASPRIFFFFGWPPASAMVLSSIGPSRPRQLIWRPACSGLVAAIVISLCSPGTGEAQVETLFTIGVETGDPMLVFGEIADVAVDAAGNIYVLDAYERQVRVFDSTGGHRQTVGRRGAGPGEFRVPRALAVSRGFLHVLDQANVRVTRYAIADSLRYVDDRRTPFPGYDLCVSSNRFFVLGYFEQLFVHELQLRDLENIHSFAEPLFEHPMLRRRTYRNIDCIADRVLTFAGEWGRIAEYLLSGRKLRELIVSDFQEIKIDLLQNGGLRFSVPDRGWYHWTLGAFPKADTVVVQVGQVAGDFRGDPDHTPDITWIGFAPGGTEVWRRTAPFRVVTYDSGRLYGVSTDPYPHVVVGRW